MVTRPLTHEELLDASTLAGVARVVRVESGVATLRFRKIFKGRVGNDLIARLGLRRQVEVALAAEGVTAEGLPVLGTWSEHCQVGDQVRVYLLWQDGAYRTPVWNALQRLP
jgi:hypothetical protein